MCVCVCVCVCVYNGVFRYLVKRGSVWWMYLMVMCELFVMYSKIFSEIH